MVSVRLPMMGWCGNALLNCLLAEPNTKAHCSHVVSLFCLGWTARPLPAQVVLAARYPPKRREERERLVVRGYAERLSICDHMKIKQ